MESKHNAGIGKVGVMWRAFLYAAVLGLVAVVPLKAVGLGGWAASYASIDEAYAAFENSQDVSAKTVAYEWIKKTVLGDASIKISGPLAKASSMAKALGEEEDFADFCLEIMESSDDDAVVAAAVALSDLRLSRGEYGKALDGLSGHLGPSSDLQPSKKAVLASKAAAVLSGKLGRHLEAVDVLGEAAAAIPPVDTEVSASLSNQKAGILLAGLSDYDRAAETARQAVVLGRTISSSTYTAALATLYSALLAKGDRAGAIAAVLESLELPDAPSGGAASKLTGAGASPDDLERAVRLIRRQAAFPFPGDERKLQSWVDRDQFEVIELLLALGKTDEAVRECRVMLFCSSTRNYPKAVESAARALKANDGNLGRANSFLEFQSADGEDVAHHANALMEFDVLDDEVRTEAAGLLATAPRPVNWNGWLARSMFHAWLDQPVKSMDCALEAFASCPISEVPLQSCVDAIVKPFIAATRDESAVRIAVDYLMFGESGPDGVRGTSDDIPDPFPAMRERLAYKPLEAVAVSEARVPDSPKTAKGME